MEKVIRSFYYSHGWYFWNWPLHAKFALGLTNRKKQVSGLVQWDDLLAMDKLCRGIRSYNTMLLVYWNRRLFYLSYHLGIMASWKSLAKGIKGHWHHLVPRPQIEPVKHNSVLWAWEGFLGHRKGDKVIWSLSCLRFLKFTPACEIYIRSH